LKSSWFQKVAQKPIHTKSIIIENRIMYQMRVRCD
jgi:hypothetical protein